MMFSLSPRKPESTFSTKTLLPSLSTYGTFTQRLWGQNVGQTVARLDPWSVGFLHTRRVGAI